MTNKQYYYTLKNCAWQVGTFSVRIGQRFMQVLHSYFPDEYDKLTGTELDPFYNDLNLYKLEESLEFVDANDQRFGVGDRVLYADPYSCILFSEIKSFTKASVVLTNGAYIAKNKVHNRIYKLN